jgi:hypothetical protein
VVNLYVVPAKAGTTPDFRQALRSKIFPKTKMPGAKAGHGNSANRERGFYAGTLSGNTASILVFSVAALNGLTM